jgi:hypothetical protein
MIVVQQTTYIAMYVLWSRLSTVTFVTVIIDFILLVVELYI